MLKQTLRYSILVLAPAIGHAAPLSGQYLVEKIDQAREGRLWEHPEWINLLHYSMDFDSYISQVKDERFFIASDGEESPEAELIETLNSLFTVTEDDNQQTQCRFVARTEWLIAQLDIDKQSLPEVTCTDYLNWKALTNADRVTMIFPAYHLNSPSSMFGHTLLRLDTSDGSKPEWLSYAVNFGANIDNDDNSILYAYRGLAGGYPGLFVTERYFKKIQEYNRIEHRDIWEYSLNLTAEETDRMIKHLWELDTMNFDYYFLDENCSYRLLELIEVARPGVELTDEFKLSAIPVDTVRAMEKANLIKSTSYRPAQATEIQYELDKMSEQQRNLVKQLSEDISYAESDFFLSLGKQQQKVTLDLAYKYLRYLNTKKSRNPAVAKRSFQLLKKINTYPSDINVTSTLPKPVPPEKGHNSKRATVGLGNRLDNNYAELGFKMAFHDLEDSYKGFLQGAQINITKLKLRVEENVGISLYQFNIIDVFSLTPRNDFFTPLSWRVYSGFERQFTLNVDQLTYHLTGGAGGTWEMIKNHQFYALAIGRLEINKQMKNAFEPAIGFTSGFLSHFKNTTARLEASGEHFQEDIFRLRLQYTQNFVLSTNHSVKLSAKHQWQENDTEFSDININYQYYF